MDTPSAPPPPAPPPSPVSRRELVLGIAGLAIAAGAGVMTARYLIHRRHAPAAATVALVYPAPRPLAPFALTASDGSAFDARRLLGRWTFVLFGYTNCPDVCPTTLLELRHVRQLLADLPATERPGVVLISVDPTRDTPERLGAYTAHFDPSFLGLTGTEAAIGSLAQSIGVAIEREPEHEGSYAVDHTAAIFLIDSSARVAAVFPTPHEAKTIAADYRAIRAGRGAGG